MDIPDIQIALTKLNFSTVFSGKTENTSSTSLIGSSVLGNSAYTSSVDGMDKLIAALNNREDLYKKQKAALLDYSDDISKMGRSYSNLQGALETGDKSEVKASLQNVINDYNKMVVDNQKYFKQNAEFDELQSAKYAKFALERDFDDSMTGTRYYGLNGLRGLGLEVGKDGLIKLDEKQFDQELNSNFEAVKGSLSDLVSKGIQTTQTYTSPDKFIGARLQRLDEALDWLSKNKPAVTPQ